MVTRRPWAVVRDPYAPLEFFSGLVELVPVVTDLLDETPGLITGDAVLVGEVVDLVAFISCDPPSVSVAPLGFVVRHWHLLVVGDRRLRLRMVLTGSWWVACR